MNKLTVQEQQHLHRELLLEREKLENQLDETKIQSEPVALDQQSVGRVSRIDAIAQQQMAISNRQQNTSRLNRINLALVALKNNEYGFCKKCEEPIGYARLRARPDTPLCIGCQSASES